MENGERRLTLDVLSRIVASINGEWELTVKLPAVDTARLTSNEDFEHKVSQQAHRGLKRRMYAGKRKVGEPRRH